MVASSQSRLDLCAKSFPVHRAQAMGQQRSQTVTIPNREIECKLISLETVIEAHVVQLARGADIIKEDRHSSDHS